MARRQADPLHVDRPASYGWRGGSRMSHQSAAPSKLAPFPDGQTSDQSAPRIIAAKLSTGPADDSRHFFGAERPERAAADVAERAHLEQGSHARLIVGEVGNGDC